MDPVSVVVLPVRDTGQSGPLAGAGFRFLTRDDGRTWEVEVRLPDGGAARGERVVAFRLGDLDRALAVPGSSTR